jgi:predicted ATP-grasp superfamily ATP-dependent carboligase
MKERFDIMILGLGPQGLFLIREFSRAGKKVIGIGMRGDVGLYSKYGKKVKLVSLADCRKAFEDYLHTELAIHIAGDTFLNYAVEMCKDIFERARCFPNMESAIVFRDKIATEKVARELGIPVPTSYILSEVKAGQQIDFPLILKWKRRIYGASFKTQLITSWKGLFRAQSEYSRNAELILQDYIEGKPEADVSLGGYYDRGKEVTSVIITQKRQFPYPNGLASFVEEYNGKGVKEIRAIAAKILERTSYSGFVEVECRYCRRRNMVFLIEVNPRVCGWIKVITRKSGTAWLTGKQNENVTSRKSVSWVNLVRDMRAIIDMAQKDSKSIEWRKVIVDYLRKPITDIFDIHDLMPFCWQFRKAI